MILAEFEMEGKTNEVLFFYLSYWMVFSKPLEKLKKLRNPNIGYLI